MNSTAMSGSTNPLVRRVISSTNRMTRLEKTRSNGVGDTPMRNTISFIEMMK